MIKVICVGCQKEGACAMLCKQLHCVCKRKNKKRVKIDTKKDDREDIKKLLFEMGIL